MEEKIYKGNFIFTQNMESFSCLENFYVTVTVSGKISGVFPDLPPQYEGWPVEEHKDGFIIPGFVDLHLHAAQYENVGLGMDQELLPWLDTYTFPEEAKFADKDYAEKVYGQFIKELQRQGTTRAVVFGTIHKKATHILFELFQKSGLGAYVGKVNMDRNASPALTEATIDSLAATEEFLSAYRNQDMVKPIITPRFAPSCSEKLMEGLGRLAKKYQAPVQSHLSENRKEVEWVSELHPSERNYGEVYHRYGLFGAAPTIMAHCVYSGENEMERMKSQGVFVAHCPTSNSNMASGIAPIKTFLSKGIQVGLGSDISGGHTLWMPDVIVHAVQASNIYGLYRPRIITDNAIREALSLTEAFYLATKGGGAFFGKVGSFEKDYDFDALFINDASLSGQTPRTLTERLSRFLYRGDSDCIVRRFVAGKEI